MQCILSTGPFLVPSFVMNLIARNSHSLFVVFGFHECISIQQGWRRPWETLVKLGVTIAYALGEVPQSIIIKINKITTNITIITIIIPWSR